jgi:hypothetical protein
MSRVINPDSAGKDRTRLTKAIVLALRELARQNDTGEKSRDLAAFIALALQTISDGIDVSVAAWEKRGYWVKADKFRMDWMWSGQYAAKMKLALLADDWTSIAMLLPQIASRLGKVEVAVNHRLGTPWTGSWRALRNQ